MNSRNDFCRMVSLICLVFFLASCGVPMIEGQKWLDSKNDKPEMNISGTRVSPEWGTATFKQEGKDVTGALGDYPARGVVSGNSLYLLMYSGEKVDYFAELKASDRDSFRGIFSKYKKPEDISDPMFRTSMSLRRVSTSP